MSEGMLVVSKKLLPKVYEKVALAKQYVNEGMNVKEACEKTEISRSTFYKYQEYVYFEHEQRPIHKLVLSFTLAHKTGSLSKVCDCFSKLNSSILTISQSVPVSNLAPVMVTLDITDTKYSLEEIKEKLLSINELHQLKVISIE